MRLLIQRVQKASLEISGAVYSQIGPGLLVFIGIEAQDKDEDIEWLVNKLVNLRIFSDSEGKMNLSVQDIQGEILVVSQFTLHASTRKGNRPSFIHAAAPNQAIPLYEHFIQSVGREMGKKPATGKFGADMKISLINDGPVSIWMDSKIKE